MQVTRTSSSVTDLGKGDEQIPSAGIAALTGSDNIQELVQLERR